MTAKETAYSEQGAFTLTEVMVAALIMLIVMGTLLSAFLSAKRSDSIAQTRLIAQQITRNEAERFMTNAYSDIVTVTNISLSNTPLETLQGTINCLVSTSSSSYKDVLITVEWINPASSRRQTLTNYMTVCNPD